MEKLTLRQNVGLVFIVTDALKSRLLREVSDAVEEVNQQITRFDFRAQHALADLQRTDLTRAMAARQQIEAEKRRLEAVKGELQDRRKEMELLEIGAEFPRGALEGNAEVMVGDSLFEKIASTQIIVRDGIIIEIRRNPVADGDIIMPISEVLSGAGE